MDRIQLLRAKVGARRRKAAVSSIIGGLIIFGIMFTVGFGYFYSISQDNALYQRAVMQYDSKQLQMDRESLTISAQVVSGSLEVAASNTGPEPSVVIAYMVTNSSDGALIQFENGTGSTPPLPYSIEPGGSADFTGIPYVSGWSYLIKVLTQDGNVFSTIYPGPSVNLADQALTSGALGDLYLDFRSFQYYNVTGGSGSTCPQGSPYSGYCLSAALPAFTIPSQVAANPLAFGITITNLNPDHYSIVLDQFTLIYETSFHGKNGQANFLSWYVISNESTSGHNAILSEYQPIILNYNIPTPVVFASSQCLKASQGPLTENSNCGGLGLQAPGTSAGTIDTVFIMTHGWEIAPPVSMSSLTYAGANYGQNLPYVSTLYS